MAKPVDKKSLRTRVLSSVVIILAVIVPAFFGGILFYLVTFAASAIGLFEFYRVFRIEKKPLGFFGYALAVLYWILLYLNKEELILPVLVFGFLFMMGFYVFGFAKTDSVKAMAAFFGFFYTVVLFSYFYRVRVLGDGVYLICLVFIGSWVCDTCAYLTGILFGKHKMAPVLSPKKSIEGAIGGVAGSVLLGLVFGLLFRSHFQSVKAPVIACTVIAFAASFISMIGDLTASAFKRNHDIKDYSHLIPGHGGILDRFDSVIFVSPVIFYLAVLFI